MGQYYKFVNKTKKEVSQISLPFNFGMSWAKALEYCENEEVKAMFHFVTKHNQDWNENDELIAVGDYGVVIKYNDIKNRKDNKFGWENYEPEKVPPKKWDGSME